MKGKFLETKIMPALIIAGSLLSACAPVYSLRNAERKKENVEVIEVKKNIERAVIKKQSSSKTALCVNKSSN